MSARTWRVTASASDRHWLCLACGRGLALGRAGASAEREAMRRMRSEPVVAPSTYPPTLHAVPPLAAPGARPHARPRALEPSGTRLRWGRLALVSLLVVIAASTLQSAGPTGKVLSAAIGFPAVLLFWISIIGWPIAAVWANLTQRGKGTHPWQGAVPRPLPVVPSSAPAGRRPPRVTGAEDNWIKGARGEHTVGAALDASGLPVLHDRRFRPGSRANIDHVVVAADAVYVVDAKNLGGSFSLAAGTFRVNGWNQDRLVQGVRRQAGEVGAALRQLGVAVPVRSVLCLTGTARPAGVQYASEVLLATPETVIRVLGRPGSLDDFRRSEVADLLAWAFPPTEGVR